MQGIYSNAVAVVQVRDGDGLGGPVVPNREVWFILRLA